VTPPPTPKESQDRCALRAEVRGDPLLGSAFPASLILLVEQPGAWGPDGLTESDFFLAAKADREFRADKG